jgi:hypothetical protein
MREDTSNNLYVLRRGGNEPPGGDKLEARVKAIEDDMQEIKSDLKSLLKDVSYIKGKVDAMPSPSAFGELKGRVDSLPTTAKAATLLSMAVAAIAIINNWAAIKAALF